MNVPKVQKLYHNFTKVTERDGSDLYFSYETLVAFQKPGQPLVVSENVWSKTTGKHLNMIAGRDARLPRDDFRAAYHAAFGD